MQLKRKTLAIINHEPDLCCLPVARSTNHEPDTILQAKGIVEWNLLKIVPAFEGESNFLKLFRATTNKVLDTMKLVSN